MDFLPLLLFLANSLDLRDFRQIILYFGLSTRTHIEYRIKSSTVTYILFVAFLDKQYVYLSSYKKNQLSIEQFFQKNCMMYTFDQYFWVETMNT